MRKYQSIVRVGSAKPIVCPQCANQVILVPDDDIEPMLWCVWENTVIDPGTQFWADIRSVVQEFYLE